MASDEDPARDAINAIMWAGFVQFAFSEPRFRDEFTRATGLALPAAPRTAIDALVDNACGLHNAFAAKFVEWVTREHWGIEHAPKAYREELEAQRV